MKSIASLCRVGFRDCDEMPGKAGRIDTSKTETLKLQSKLMLERLKSRARALKQETLALYFAFRDPRTPWYARAFAALVVAYALSPIDLIPDFVPVFGYLDDLILIPAGIALALKMIPPQVMAEARVMAASHRAERRMGFIGAGIIALIWILTIIIALALFARLLFREKI